MTCRSKCKGLDLDLLAKEVILKMGSQQKKFHKNPSKAHELYKKNTLNLDNSYVSRPFNGRHKSMPHEMQAEISESLEEERQAICPTCLEFESSESQLVLKVCQLLCEDDLIADLNDAQLWCERGAEIDPCSPAVINLKNKLDKMMKTPPSSSNKLNASARYRICDIGPSQSQWAGAINKQSSIQQKVTAASEPSTRPSKVNLSKLVDDVKKAESQVDLLRRDITTIAQNLCQHKISHDDSSARNRQCLKNVSLNNLKYQSGPLPVDSRSSELKNAFSTCKNPVKMFSSGTQNVFTIPDSFISTQLQSNYQMYQLENSSVHALKPNICIQSLGEPCAYMEKQETPVGIMRRKCRHYYQPKRSRYWNHQIKHDYSKHTDSQIKDGYSKSIYSEINNDFSKLISSQVKDECSYSTEMNKKTTLCNFTINTKNKNCDTSINSESNANIPKHVSCVPVPMEKISKDSIELNDLNGKKIPSLPSAVTSQQTRNTDSKIKSYARSNEREGHLKKQAVILRPSKLSAVIEKIELATTDTGFQLKSGKVLGTKAKSEANKESTRDLQEELIKSFELFSFKSEFNDNVENNGENIKIINNVESLNMAKTNGANKNLWGLSGSQSDLSYTSLLDTTTTDTLRLTNQEDAGVPILLTSKVSSTDEEVGKKFTENNKSQSQFFLNTHINSSSKSSYEREKCIIDDLVVSQSDAAKVTSQLNGGKRSRSFPSFTFLEYKVVHPNLIYQETNMLSNSKTLSLSCPLLSSDHSFSDHHYVSIPDKTDEKRNLGDSSVDRIPLSNSPEVKDLASLDIPDKTDDKHNLGDDLVAHTNSFEETGCGKLSSSITTKSHMAPVEPIYEISDFANKIFANNNNYIIGCATSNDWSQVQDSVCISTTKTVESSSESEVSSSSKTVENCNKSKSPALQARVHRQHETEHNKKDSLYLDLPVISTNSNEGTFILSGETQPEPSTLIDTDTVDDTCMRFFYEESKSKSVADYEAIYYDTNSLSLEKSNSLQEAVEDSQPHSVTDLKIGSISAFKDELATKWHNVNQADNSYMKNNSDDFLEFEEHITSKMSSTMTGTPSSHVLKENTSVVSDICISQPACTFQQSIVNYEGNCPIAKSTENNIFFQTTDPKEANLANPTNLLKETSREQKNVGSDDQETLITNPSLLQESCSLSSIPKFVHLNSSTECGSVKRCQTKSDEELLHSPQKSDVDPHELPGLVTQDSALEETSDIIHAKRSVLYSSGSSFHATFNTEHPKEANLASPINLLEETSREQKNLDSDDQETSISNPSLLKASGNYQNRVSSIPKFVDSNSSTKYGSVKRCETKSDEELLQSPPNFEVDSHELSGLVTQNSALEETSDFSYPKRSVLYSPGSLFRVTFNTQHPKEANLANPINLLGETSREQKNSGSDVKETFITNPSLLLESCNLSSISKFVDLNSSTEYGSVKRCQTKSDEELPYLPQKSDVDSHELSGLVTQDSAIEETSDFSYPNKSVLYSSGSLFRVTFDTQHARSSTCVDPTDHLPESEESLGLDSTRKDCESDSQSLVGAGIGDKERISPSDQALAEDSAAMVAADLGANDDSFVLEDSSRFSCSVTRPTSPFLVRPRLLALKSEITLEFSKHLRGACVEAVKRIDVGIEWQSDFLNRKEWYRQAYGFVDVITMYFSTGEITSQDISEVKFSSDDFNRELVFWRSLSNADASCTEPRGRGRMMLSCKVLFAYEYKVKPYDEQSNRLKFLVKTAHSEFLPKFAVFYSIP